VLRPGAGYDLKGFLWSLPGLVRRDRQLARYSGLRFLGSGFFIMAPFLSSYTLRTLGKPDSFLGTLLALQMGGLVAGNLAGGWLGDRRGGRVLALAGHVAFAGICLAAPFLAGEGAFSVLYVVFGFASGFNNIGLSTLSMDLSPVRSRVSYQAVINFISMAGLLVFPFMGSLIRNQTQSFLCLALPAALALLVCVFLMWRIREPRNRGEGREMPFQPV
jgi:MFS family permease